MVPSLWNFLMSWRYMHLPLAEVNKTTNRSRMTKRKPRDNGFSHRFSWFALGSSLFVVGCGVPKHLSKEIVEETIKSKNPGHGYGTYYSFYSGYPNDCKLSCEGP